MLGAFAPLVSSVVFTGLIAAIFSVAVLAIGFVLAKNGALSVVDLLKKITGQEWVDLGKNGVWKKDTYEQAMLDLNFHYHHGGLMDKESLDALAHWQINNSDSVHEQHRDRKYSRY